MIRHSILVYFPYQVRPEVMRLYKIGVRSCPEVTDVQVHVAYEAELALFIMIIWFRTPDDRNDWMNLGKIVSLRGVGQFDLAYFNQIFLTTRRSGKTL